MTDLKSLLNWLRPRGPNASIEGSFAPYIPPEVDEGQLIADVSRIFALKRAHVRAKLCEYRTFYEVQGYGERLGERKTLSFEEAFIIHVIIQTTRPRTIVEIGTDYGKSTRRIIDIKNLLGMESKVICFDVVNHVKHFTEGEAQLILKDVTKSFNQDVLEAYAPGMIFLDAHSYYLLRSVISAVLNDSNDWILTIHDCSRGLCNPKMTQSKHDLDVKSSTGVWERHVLAEILNVANPLSKRLDNFQTSTHHIKVFETPHGLAVILPKRLLQVTGGLG